MPIFRLPFHVSYLIYIAGFSPRLARLYFTSALMLCRLTGVQPSLLLHPLDFLGADDGLEPLRFFPGMNIASTTKLAWLDGFITEYRHRFDIVPIGAHVEALEAYLAAGIRPDIRQQHRFGDTCGPLNAPRDRRERSENQDEGDPSAWFAASSASG
jgi:hypothetical protein